MGQNVMVRNFREGPQWIQAVVVEQCVPVSYPGANIEWKCLEVSHRSCEIDSDDSAAEGAKEKVDCDLTSPEIFPGEAEQTSATSNASIGNTGQSSLLPPTSQTIHRSSRSRQPPNQLTFKEGGVYCIKQVLLFCMIVHFLLIKYDVMFMYYFVLIYAKRFLTMAHAKWW